ncbi:uncharacterized protein CLUP02_08004 [Colletotrichum lupini]|uniref:Uncharacterized protein n=1 Tax=Colletotrichum lupini TaxID=145971 RepID=A0A9Q8SS62_9PEZI|nr:uncharacterized protein CLUP02_08004 [Colletotrichum lupini]UQC82516.1 hypothetical protein CLUP02_08004 [Colletotrichum lupini]
MAARLTSALLGLNFPFPPPLRNDEDGNCPLLPPSVATLFSRGLCADSHDSRVRGILTCGLPHHALPHLTWCQDQQQGSSEQIPALDITEPGHGGADKKLETFLFGKATETAGLRVWKLCNGPEPHWSIIGRSRPWRDSCDGRTYPLRRIDLEPAVAYVKADGRQLVLPLSLFGLASVYVVGAVWRLVCRQVLPIKSRVKSRCATNPAPYDVTRCSFSHPGPTTEFHEAERNPLLSQIFKDLHLLSSSSRHLHHTMTTHTLYELLSASNGDTGPRQERRRAHIPQSDMNETVSLRVRQSSSLPAAMPEELAHTIRSQSSYFGRMVVSGKYVLARRVAFAPASSTLGHGRSRPNGWTTQYDQMARIMASISPAMGP